MRLAHPSSLVCLALLVGGCGSVPVRDSVPGSGPPGAASTPAGIDDPLGEVGGASAVLAPSGVGAGFDDTVISTAFDAARVGGAPTGAAVRYRRADGSVGTVRPGAPYAAASGRTCRVLRDAEGAATGRVLCAATGPDDGWTLVPRLGARDGMQDRAGGDKLSGVSPGTASRGVNIGALSMRVDETFRDHAARIDARPGDVPAGPDALVAR